MALQINTQVGSAAPLAQVDPAAPSVPSGAALPVVPQYQMNFAGLTRSMAAGLSAPTSVGDLEVLFAQIASNLKDSLGALAKMDGAARSEASRGALGQAMAAFDQMVRWGVSVDTNRENIKVQQKIVDDQTVERDTAVLAKQNLQGQVDTKQGQINTNTTNISAYQGTINTLSTEKNALLNEKSKLNATKDAVRIGQIDARVNQINGDLSYLGGLITNLQTANTTLQGEINTLNGQITTQQGIIDGAQLKIDAANKSKKDSEDTIRSALSSMESFVDSTVLLMMAARGSLQGEMARNAALFDTQGDTFDTLLGNMAQALVALGEVLAQGRIDADVATVADGAGLNLDQSVPERFGQQSAPVARAMAFAGVVAGTLAVVGEVVRNLTQGLGMQSAGSFAQAGEPRVRVPV